ncbi:hypothetical protein ABB30_02935 [Stenotrophomonas ginsengisoli]|uniref:Transcription regulator PadR N-terminal domain-containing protein n=1 Tax=Stenotrophomonas ginsengisoli TaxID=336566 RepID=A0A0R0DLZ2_9GAMM|nr:PadR family transcriptional regulator [Stenotrophomonas ginsengisoli]KRG78739.1 hypothetical protein ABB30_02935 [Stenotrophomonas ginsengisoli]
MDIPAPAPSSPRPLGRGDLRWLLLWLLGQRPHHGYELIQQVSQMFARRYTPSAGSVYPLLAEFERQHWVLVEPGDGRKCYRLSSTGQALLQVQDEAVQDALLRARHSARQLAKQQLPAPIRQAMAQLTQQLLQQRQPWPPQQVAAAAALIAQAAIVLGADPASPPDPA